ncbi:expressed unknown protein [Seminavis robusta]|uniref:Uncharacterized protein n=1 Tax=Seminavis robusta TaxID=568900 RepID=A0A9N8HG70_9STRA|nr:expressed unknown protein [Seminavis robusta]|eukprot:Sro493_g154130.1 n/a (297) ;mRNA; r:41551-42771
MVSGPAVPVFGFWILDLDGPDGSSTCTSQYITYNNIEKNPTMKISTSLITCFLLSSASAFAPKSIVSQKQGNVISSAATPTTALFMAEETEAEEIERLVQEELRKTKRMSNLRNEKGVDYAPWMNISEEDEKQIRQLMAEKAAARRKRQEQERTVSGALLMDSQAQELSGGGLKPKIIGEDIQLEWATSREANTKCFKLKRRAAKTNDFQTIAELPSQGLGGGVYSFFDDQAGPGGWVYRVTEVENNGRESDISQCLVEVQTKEEQRGAVIAAGGIAVLMAGLLAAGVLLDPNGGY